jgi:thiol-disulfide isomerase/thioredoxin
MRASDLSTSKTTRRAVLVLIGLTITGLHGANAEPALKNWTGPNPAPSIDLNTLDGQPFRLERLRGKVVLVNFWATWCEPCVEEMPSMQKLRNLLANAPFEIVAVNHQEGEARIRGFLQKVPLDFPIVRDTDGAVTRAWQTRIFPSSYLVDAEGKIRYVLAGATDWTAPAMVRTVESLLPRRQAAR